ncbi:uncharacterized protein F23F12.8-like [Camponotus floridanus]|uniref:uncharacterized protein F23F12.8-like n=1 Tax=Camponotus floridanus TaxID=104421 RepID=UPI000DC67978|nr:uncharacterized protein F23F12.8-like [Camponotus floridanus]
MSSESFFLETKFQFLFLQNKIIKKAPWLFKTRYQQFFFLKKKKNFNSYLYKIVEKDPWLLDEIFPPVYPRPDVTQEVQEDVIDVVYERPTDYDEKIEEIPFKAIEDIVEVKPIQEEVEEIKIVQEPAVIPTERIADRDEEEIDLIEEEFPIVQEPAVIPTERIADRDEEEIDLIEEEFPIVQEPAVIPTERITDRDDEKIDLVEEKELPIVQEPVIPTERIADHDDEKLDLVKEEEIVQEAAILQERAVIPVERDYDEDRDEEKIDLIKEEELVIETTVAEEIPVEKPEILDEDEIERTAKIELELPRELEEYFEPEKPVEYDEDEEGLTDYEKFIDEELQEFLPAIIAREIPKEPREMRPEIPRNAVYEKIDRDIEPEERRAEEEEVPTKVKRIVSRKPVTADVCDETCPLVKKQKERFMRKLKERQRVVDYYYLTKGFNYFEDVCTCSLACMVYTLSRDPFMRSVFASLALFAVGLKLCSELDAWEMPNRVS